MLLNLDIMDQVLVHLESKEINKDSEIRKNSKLKEEFD